MILIEKLWAWYYKIFPKELKRKQEREEQERKARERQEKADLLLEFQELMKRKDELTRELEWDCEGLDKFTSMVYALISSNPFEKRMKNETAASIIESFSLEKIDDHEAVKQKAIECEKLFFRIFTVRQKLKLYGIDRGLEDDQRLSE